MKKINRQINPIFSIFSIIILSVLLAGCPGPRPHENPTDNYLEIPPLGTEFVFAGEDINWDWQTHPRVMSSLEQVELLKNTPDNEVAGKLRELADAAFNQMNSDPDYHEAVYDLVYDDLSVEERTKIETVLCDTVFHTLAYKVTEYDTTVNFWANDPDTNYFLIFHSTAGLIAIILKDIEPDAEALAEHCWTRVQDAMQALTDQNGWVEGLTYLDFCWGQSACYFLLALERNSDLKPFDEPWFQASARWASWGALPDRETIACFGDNEPENYSVGSYFYRIWALTGQEWFHSEAEARPPIQYLALDLPIFEAMCVGREKTLIPDSIIPDFNANILTDHFPGLEWGFIRAGTESEDRNPEDDFYLAFKSGVS
ncbi:MAG: hypothetical protein NTY09_04470, partial [bacterium]|nr:hypothetical protein [bacterium]